MRDVTSLIMHCTQGFLAKKYISVCAMAEWFGDWCCVQKVPSSNPGSGVFLFFLSHEMMFFKKVFIFIFSFLGFYCLIILCLFKIKNCVHF